MKHKLSPRGKRRFIIFFLSMVIGFVAQFQGSHFLYKRFQDRRLRGELEQILRQISAAKSETLLCVHTMASNPVLEEFFLNPDGNMSQETVQASCQKYENSLPPSCITFFVSDKDLRYYENGVFQYRVFPPSAQDGWYEAAYEEDYCLITKETDSLSRRSWLRMSVPVYRADGRKSGIAGIRMPVDAMGDLLHIPWSERNKYLLLRDEGGNFASFYALSDRIEEKAMLYGLQEELKQLPLKHAGILQGTSSLGEFQLSPLGDNWSLLLIYPFSVGSYIFSHAFMFGILLFVTAIIFSIVQTRRYIRENKIIREQKKEIEILNENQSSFFSSMSHEIRTPINTIIGLDEMILREDISEEVAEDARGIAGASNMLLALINDILDMSKLTNGKMEIVHAPYDTGTMLLDIINMIMVKAKEKGLEFQVDIAPDIPSSLLGDEVRIKQVLLNLLSNAVKYTREGTVAFKVRCEHLGYGVVNVTFSVEDTGIGVKKESIPYLFDAFKRVDVQKNHMIEGTGLGLSIVKQLVELMGGTIDVRSIYLRGSTFTVTLSQEVVNPEAIGELDLKSRSGHGRVVYKQSFEAPSARILIVDDNEMNLTVETKLLRGTKIQVDTADSGKKALAMAQVTRYNVILMDHLMPGMDGITCLHEIRNQPGGLNRSTPAIALTANAGRKNELLYEREGFDSYLSKPVNGEQLESMLLAFLPADLVMLRGESIRVQESVSSRKLSSRKMPLLISTDSVCDIPLPMLRSLGIPILSTPIVTDEGYFKDNLEVDTDSLLYYIQNTGKTVVSKDPSVEEYEEFFARQLQKTQYLIHITMSSRLGNSFANACQAAKSFDNVTVVDSLLISSSMGMLVLQARQFARETPSPQMVLEKIEEYKKLFSVSFMVDNLDYLERGGHVSHFANSLCRALLIHPILTVRKGAMRLSRVEFGELEKTREIYVRSALRNKSSIDDSVLFITYAGLSYQELQAVKEQALSIVPFKQVYLQKASPAVSSNCGPGSMGLLFKRRLRKGIPS
ncbi:MAG: DegV family EDD domain-containing protein [Treponema sp.]|nr:DegV family EDD domain-containing protein [Treponema sp.]